MRWQNKALVQRLCAGLPFGSEAVYYALQRTFGSMRHPPDPLPNFRDLARIAAELRRLGFSLENKRVMEVGSGRRLDMPIGFFLLGAASVVTFDLHRYQKDSLVMATLREMATRKDEIISLFEPLTGKAPVAERLSAIQTARSTAELLDIARIDYRAPADASTTGLPSGSIDLQFSYTVFEHIPYGTLLAILRECSRLLSPAGLACHHIDLSDHFAHDDPSVSFINFLGFEEKEWATYNDNQFAYQNRLRLPDYERLYRDARHNSLVWQSWVDQRSLDEIARGFPLAETYRGAPHETLATVVLRVTSRASDLHDEATAP
jgi:Methyltransferase domain